jgi:hypothetical protein
MRTGVDFCLPSRKTRDCLIETIRTASPDTALAFPVEAESGLRQNLAEITVSRAELRKEMDDLRRDHGGSSRNRPNQSSKGRDRKPGFAAEPRRALEFLIPPAPLAGRQFIAENQKSS